MTTPELTVEQALKELREIFPRTYISLTATAIWFGDEAEFGANYNIVVGAHRYEFFGKTLSEAMAQVRKFHDEGVKATIDAHRDAQGQY